MMNKVLLGCFCSVVGLMCVPGVHAQLDNVDNPLTKEKHSGAAHQIGVIGLNDASSTEEGGQDDALINVVKGWINWILGILALVALIILIYGGLLMVTAAGNEERYNKGRTILKHAAIGLIVVGISRFIVSIIFWLINQSTTTAEGSGANTAN